MVETLAFKGEMAALSAALLWAVATVLFGRLGRQLPPLILNLAKGGIAIALMLLTLLFRQQLWTALPVWSVGLLLLSGAIGIGLGDTAYFAAVNTLGPRRALLMETLAPPLSALMAWVSLHETLAWTAWLGLGLTVIGVAWVISERVPTLPGVSPAQGRGILFGSLAALAQSVGAVLSRAALAGTSVDPVWGTLLRLAAGVGLTIGLLGLRSSLWQALQPLRSPRLLGGVAIAAFFGTYLAIWLQQTALKYAPAGVAQALMATSPIVVLPMVFVLKEQISARAVLGGLVALGGVWLLFQ
jgi:drug/metabolite transporter (DMT)-like permease